MLIVYKIRNWKKGKLLFLAKIMTNTWYNYKKIIKSSFSKSLSLKESNIVKQFLTSQSPFYQLIRNYLELYVFLKEKNRYIVKQTYSCQLIPEILFQTAFIR